MFRRLAAIVCAQILPAALCAHEFWIEPEEMQISEGGAMKPVLMIGEHPEGQTYAFQPQAFAQATWSGPEDQIEMSRLPLSGPAPAYRAFSPGLHSLAVSSFPQKLTYESHDQFRRFLAEIGKDELYSLVKSGPEPEKAIRETYRRFAKTIVHFNDRSGADRRIGLQREWVWKDDTFTLYDGARPSAHQNIKMICRTGASPQAVTKIAMQTDRNGAIKPALPARGRCLINAVFLAYDANLGRWRSDWVSLFFSASPTPETDGRGQLAN